jgi:hypothetical protein
MTGTSLDNIYLITYSKFGSKNRTSEEDFTSLKESIIKKTVYSSSEILEGKSCYNGISVSCNMQSNVNVKALL